MLAATEDVHFPLFYIQFQCEAKHLGNSAVLFLVAVTCRWSILSNQLSDVMEDSVTTHKQVQMLNFGEKQMLKGLA